MGEPQEVLGWLLLPLLPQLLMVPAAVLAVARLLDCWFAELL